MICNGSLLENAFRAIIPKQTIVVRCIAMGKALDNLDNPFVCLMTHLYKPTFQGLNIVRRATSNFKTSVRELLAHGP